MSRRSHLGTRSLLWRQFTADLGASVTVAVIVLITALLATAAPRAIESMYSQSLRFAISEGAPPQRDLSADSYGGPIVGPGVAEGMTPETAAQWGRQAESLLALYDEFPPAMAEVFSPPLVIVAYDAIAVATPPEAAGSPEVNISLGFDPLWLENIEIAEGRLPAPLTTRLSEGTPIEIVLSTAAAERMEWPVGQSRSSSVSTNATQQLVLTGTFEAIDPESDYWDHMITTLRPTVIDNGNSPPTVQAVAYLDPASWEFTDAVSTAARSHLWFPLRVDRVSMADAEQLATELRGFTAVAHTVGSDGFPIRPTMSSVELGTPLISTIDGSLQEANSTNAVLAMAASGPIGVLLAVLFLGARLIVERRRAGLTLAAARGGSAGQLRGIMALEGLVIGVPAAVIGIAIGLLLTPSPTSAAALLLPAALGLAPAAILALVSSPGRMRRGRSDLDPRASGRIRWLGEVVVLALAALSVYLLLQRGLTTAVGRTGVDPLLAATPLLLSLAACVLVMRLYPLPLAAVNRAAGRARTLTSFLGSARALRDPVAGLAPVLALVVGISIAVFSSIVLSTVREGVADAALGSVGADMSVTAPSFSEEQIEQIRTIPGVDAAAAIGTQASSTVRINGKSSVAALIVFDQAELALVQKGVPGALPVTARLADPGEPSVLISGNLGEDLVAGDKVELGSVRVDVAGIGDSRNPFGVRPDWVGIDQALAHDLYGTKVFLTRVVLLDVAAGTSAEEQLAIEQSLAEISGEGAVVRTAAAETSLAQENPTVMGMQIALFTAVVLAGLLCGVGVILTLVLGRPARERLLALLRIVGLDRAQARRLALWELAPMSIVALIVGGALGALLPLVVLVGVDLRPFTGAREQPGASVDPLLLAVVAGGFLFVVAAATAASMFIARNVNLARILRSAEEG